MGSAKDLVRGDSLAGRLYIGLTHNEFGRGGWSVSGKFSVKDLKDLIPPFIIPQKAEALAMTTGAFFEYSANKHPDIPTCYLGVMDQDGKVTDTKTLLDRGELSNVVVMKIAHTPKTFCKEDLNAYRTALASGTLQCGVADVESIFRNGFPLGSSTFKKIFGAVGKLEEYGKIATYDETVAALDSIRAMVEQHGLSQFPALEKILQSSKLGTTIPNPGFVLKDFAYDTTTKFEVSGDRDIPPEEAERYSGLSHEGYRLWAEEMVPTIAQAQIDFCRERGILNIDGKMECVAYRRMPVVTDFACTVDENRLMIEVDVGGVKWAIPSNKEIQRAIFTREGIDVAIYEAKKRAEEAGNVDDWKDYMPKVLDERGINIMEVTEHSCNLMADAIGEVANRILGGKKVFDAKPIDSWVGEFIPYASQIQRME